jgi:Secretion system C-terminal sorting domain
LSDYALGLFLIQSNDTLRYNTYFVISEDACKATFVQDKNNDGSIGTPQDSTYKSFHQYAKKSGYDQTSSCEGQTYNPNGCGTTAAAKINADAFAADITGKINFTVYPNPVVNDLSIQFNMQKNAPVSIELIDLSGHVLINRRQELTKGAQRIMIKGFKQKGMASGIYLVRVTTPDEIKTTKFIVE